MKFFVWIPILTFSFVVGGCASLQSASLSSIPAKRDQPVHSEVGRMIILGFNFDNDYVNRIQDDLKRQCPGGDVRGILTKDEVIDYFLFIVWKRKVTADGYCVGADRS